MHEKLRHQLNTHKISGHLNNGQQSSASFIPSPFFLKKKRKPKQQTGFTIKRSSVDQACKVKTNLTSRREV
jgi:hypothetical protein